MIKGYVSVIVPVYNCEKHIIECVNSIENSDYNNIEIIIVNDGSTDGSDERCRTLESKFKNIKYYIQDNSGVSVARNLGIKKASGEYIAFVDGDDLVKPNMISRLVEMMNQETDITCCGYSVLDNGSEHNEFFFNKSFSANSFKEKNSFFMQLLDESYGRDGRHYSTAIGVPWGKLYRSDIVKRLLFDPELRRMQDNVFNMYAFDIARAIKYKNEALYVYRLEHVMGYTKGVKLVNPVNLDRISMLRNTFFQEHPDYFTDDIKKALLMDDISFFGTCMQYYIINNNDKKSTCHAIKEFCALSNISKMIKNSNVKIPSLKRRCLQIMCKYNMSNCLYWSYIYITRITHRRG